ncbi:MAG: OmpA family protein [Anaerovoracaceae bacterium]
MADHANNEWISIGDFMAGIVGVLVLFFVIAILITATSQAEAEEKKQQGAIKVIKAIEQTLKESGNSKGITFLPEKGIIRLEDSSFAQGSACLDSNLKRVFQEKFAPLIQKNMRDNRLLDIQIEGHTDAAPVNGVKANITQVCSPFDDNYTLSAGRAREARKALFAKITSSELIQRISVVGYGPDRLLNKENPNAASNRRVEIRFIIRDI